MKGVQRQREGERERENLIPNGLCNARLHCDPSRFYSGKKVGNTQSTLQMEKEAATTRGVMYSLEVWRETGCRRNNKNTVKLRLKIP
jgi:hypothetical protein